jgi:tRNA(Ile)-lysidine synthase
MRGRVFLEAIRRWLPGAPARASTVAGIEALMDTQVGGRVALLQGTIWREREHLVFRTSQQVTESGTVQPLSFGEMVAVPGGAVGLHRVDGRPPVLDAGDDTVYVDAEQLTLPLALRPWRPGDRLRPLGMDHRKKVSDLLTERKVPSHERADVHVVCSGEDIIWVVEHRLAHRVRIRPETRSIAKIAYIPASDEKKG